MRNKKRLKNKEILHSNEHILGCFFFVKKDQFSLSKEQDRFLNTVDCWIQEYETSEERKLHSTQYSFTRHFGLLSNSYIRGLGKRTQTLLQTKVSITRERENTDALD